MTGLTGLAPASGDVSSTRSAARRTRLARTGPGAAAGAGARRQATARLALAGASTGRAARTGVGTRR
ncbi:MAG: hypothetical protein WD316_01735 [Phycisphaeraceae bacterium]